MRVLDVRISAVTAVLQITFALESAVLRAEGGPVHAAFNVGLRAAVCPHPDQPLLHLGGKG